MPESGRRFLVGRDSASVHLPNRASMVCIRQTTSERCFLPGFTPTRNSNFGSPILARTWHSPARLRPVSSGNYKRACSSGSSCPSRLRTRLRCRVSESAIGPGAVPTARAEGLEEPAFANSLYGKTSPAHLIEHPVRRGLQSGRLDFDQPIDCARKTYDDRSPRGMEEWRPAGNYEFESGNLLGEGRTSATPAPPETSTSPVLSRYRRGAAAFRRRSRIFRRRFAAYLLVVAEREIDVRTGKGPPALAPPRFERGHDALLHVERAAAPTNPSAFDREWRMGPCHFSASAVRRPSRRAR